MTHPHAPALAFLLAALVSREAAARWPCDKRRAPLPDPTAALETLTSPLATPSGMFDAANDLQCAEHLDPSAVDRLVALLRAELDDGPGVPVDVDDLERNGPRVIDPGTLTRIDALVFALGAFGADAAVAVPLLRRIERDARPSTRLRARTAIARTGTPDAVAVLTEDLDARGDAAYLALETLRSLEARGAPMVPKLGAMLDAGAGEHVAETLGEIGDARAVEPLVRALQRRDFGVIAKSSEALAKLGAPAAVAIPMLDRIASTHWSPVARDAAATASTKLSGTPHVAANVRNHGTFGASSYLAWSGLSVAHVPRVGWSGVHSALSSSNGGAASESERHHPDCRSAAEKAKAWTSVRVRDTCVLGLDEGEWGGSVLVAAAASDDVPTLVAKTAGVRRLMVDGDRVFVLTGTSHMGGTYGHVSTASATDGTWRVRDLTRLPGDVLGVARDGRGLWVVAVEEESREHRVASAFRMSEDGELTRAWALGVPPGWMFAVGLGPGLAVYATLRLRAVLRRRQGRL
jgi:HEAT repeat protein